MLSYTAFFSALVSSQATVIYPSETFFSIQIVSASRVMSYIHVRYVPVSLLLYTSCSSLCPGVVQEEVIMWRLWIIPSKMSDVLPQDYLK